jgi:hypothetical protein
MRFILPLAIILWATTTAAANLLPNASFSDPDVSDWVSGGLVAHTYSSDQGSDLPGDSGPGAMTVTYSYFGGAWAGARYLVDGIGPGVYDVGGSFLIPEESAQGQELTVMVEFRDASNNTLDRVNSGLVSASGAWTASRRSLEAPPGTTRAWIYAAVFTPSGSTEDTPPSVGVFDDLFFTGEGGPVQELFVPAAASAPGQNGTQWSTGGWIANASDATLTISAALLGAGADNLGALSDAREIATVPPQGSIRIEDVVAALGESNTGGGLYLAAQADGVVDPPLVVVTTHTFTPNPDGAGTFGQGIPAQAPGAGGRKLIPGAVQTTAFRTNVGVLNTSGTTSDITIVIRRASGTVVSTTTWTLAPYEWRQQGLPSLGAGSLVDGSIEVLAEDWVSYLAYASTVDQRSGDAVFSAAR